LGGAAAAWLRLQAALARGGIQPVSARRGCGAGGERGAPRTPAPVFLPPRRPAGGGPAGRCPPPPSPRAPQQLPPDPGLRHPRPAIRVVDRLLLLRRLWPRVGAAHARLWLLPRRV
jgi:hypothetical protein